MCFPYKPQPLPWPVRPAHPGPASLSEFMAPSLTTVWPRWPLLVFNLSVLQIWKTSKINYGYHLLHTSKLNGLNNNHLFHSRICNLGRVWSGLEGRGGGARLCSAGWGSASEHRRTCFQEEPLRWLGSRPCCQLGARLGWGPEALISLLVSLPMRPLFLQNMVFVFQGVEPGERAHRSSVIHRDLALEVTSVTSASFWSSRQTQSCTQGQKKKHKSHLPLDRDWQRSGRVSGTENIVTAIFRKYSLP